MRVSLCKEVAKEAAYLCVIPSIVALAVMATEWWISGLPVVSPVSLSLAFKPRLIPYDGAVSFCAVFACVFIIRLINVVCRK
jgi:hypothetical protein